MRESIEPENAHEHARISDHRPTEEIRLTGHRIDLYDVMKSYNEGHTAEMLRHEYPTLPLGLIYKVLAFCFENRADVDLYVKEVERKLDGQQAAHEPSRAQLQIRGIVAEKRHLPNPRASLSIAPTGRLAMNLPDFLTVHERDRSAWRGIGSTYSIWCPL